ncbi:ATP-dependent helicase [[Clostridium] fimetarium]|uniref:DNA 3'-5' helicase n=1 Tax=[Clostridium] fimetarium TaxID=99656 RepID=A0A1I0MW44_9FIRM|nr:ATP-dependent helicase [[Clostridium] fimetarium]SEV93101.1 DNA helicase-2 / ATP-dependent DNA helicase PcrA [[Clostridium] fimetarium]
MSFNEAQISAINHNSGPAIVLAGPGSGKTTVITLRTKRLIEYYNVDPSKILVITFTKMAANEMKERFFKLMDGKKPSVTFGTYHAVFFTILKNAYNYSAKNIIREEQQREYIKRMISKYDLEIEDENEFVSSVLGEISQVKGSRINLQLYYSINCPEDVFRSIYQDYDSELKRNRLIDFDDMLVFCYELLSNRSDILSAWQNKYQYILVDEFQDINKVQYDVIKLLVEKSQNLFIVGDDDQSIYGFRGAKPEIMLDFTKDFVDAVKINLDINYRSTSNIVNSAKSVIDNNSKRFYKDIRAFNQIGNMVDIREFIDTSDENKYIIDSIQKYIEDGTKYKDIAVLSRTNIGARQLIGKLIEYNIPFTTRDIIPNLYEHWIAKNIFSYIRIAMGNRDRFEFLQIMNKPKRYISRDSMGTPLVDFEELRKLYEDKQWMVQRIDDFEKDLQLLKKMNPFAAINFIRRGIGFDDYLREYSQARRMNAEDLLNVITEIQEEAREFSTYSEWFKHIEDYNLELKEQVSSMGKTTDAVNLCTMHSSKGLEYKVVYIIDANEGIMPYNKAVLESEIEEERRMFYVAMTRAKEDLHIFYTKERYNKKQEVSRFVSEISKKYVMID